MAALHGPSWIETLASAAPARLPVNASPVMLRPLPFRGRRPTLPTGGAPGAAELGSMSNTEPTTTAIVITCRT